jgi:predicted enzyme related to lactoylglutathione lyase
MANSIRHIQILSESPDQTARFYGDLFGWTVDANNPMGYRRIETGANDGVQAGIWPAPPQAGSFVQFFVGVSDLQLALARAQELGAKILIGPANLPEGDQMAVLQDPLGMPFGMWQRPGN